MKFKELKTFIYDDVVLLLGPVRIYGLTIRDTDKYDNFEVVGIRANDNKLLISLKEPVYINPYLDEVDNLQIYQESSYQAK